MDGLEMDGLENVEQNSQKCPFCYLYLFAGEDIVDLPRKKNVPLIVHAACIPLDKLICKNILPQKRTYVEMMKSC